MIKYLLTPNAVALRPRKVCDLPGCPKAPAWQYGIKLYHRRDEKRPPTIKVELDYFVCNEHKVILTREGLVVNDTLKILCAQTGTVPEWTEPWFVPILNL